MDWSIFFLSGKAWKHLLRSVHTLSYFSSKMCVLIETNITSTSLPIPQISALLIAAFQCSVQVLIICGPHSLRLPSEGSWYTRLSFSLRHLWETEEKQKFLNEYHPSFGGRQTVASFFSIVGWNPIEQLGQRAECRHNSNRNGVITKISHPACCILPFAKLIVCKIFISHCLKGSWIQMVCICRSAATDGPWPT